jgi:hypothetical protein
VRASGARRVIPQVIDTRPFVLGATRTGVKLDDAAKTARLQLGRALRAGRLAVVDVEDEPPDLPGKVCKKYHDALPIQMFDPRAQAWRKDILRGGGGVADPAARVLLMSSATPGAYVSSAAPSAFLRARAHPDGARRVAWCPSGFSNLPAAVPTQGPRPLARVC